MKKPAATESVSRRGFLGRVSLAAAALLSSSRSRGAAPNETPRKLGVALVGLGTYSTGQLGPALKETKHCRLAGVVTGSKEKGIKWAKDFGFPENSIYSYDTMARMADNPDIDIVYVVTPNSLHATHALAAVKAGKHLISEKPFTTTVADADAVLAACRLAKVKHSIGYRLHFEPHHQELKRLALEKDFGALTKMTGDFSFRMGQRVWRADRRWSGGGPLMDVGIYVIQAACMAAGGVPPIAVTAKEGPKTRPEIFADVEESLTWKMEFPHGEVCEAEASYSRNVNTFRAEGSKGWIEFTKEAFSYRGVTAETIHGKLDRPSINQQAAQLDDFALCIREGRESRVSGEMGRRDMVIIEAIYRSMTTGQRVEVKV